MSARPPQSRPSGPLKPQKPPQAQGGGSAGSRKPPQAFRAPSGSGDERRIGGPGGGRSGRSSNGSGGGPGNGRSGGLGKVSLTSGGKVVGSNRDWKLLIVFCLAAVVLIGQLVHLQVFAAPELQEEARAQRTSPIDLPARRGTIYDRTGNVLAKSVDAITIYANPKEIIDPQATARILAEELGGESSTYYEQLIENTTFVYILQKADEEQAQRLKDRNQELKRQLAAAQTSGQNANTSATQETALYGIHYLQDTKRVYPYGSIGAQVIGMVGVDNGGLFGLEHMYDSVLSGTDGTLSTEYALAIDGRPLSGQPIPGSERVELAPVDGQDIIVSIDIDLQQYVELELARAGVERETENGSALVLDGATGEIYAAASLPLFDRENLSQEAIEKGATTLKAVCLNYEPGSIFKPLTAAAILEERAMSPDEELYVPAQRRFSEYVVSDSHPRPDETMSFTTIIAKSSNVGISLVKDRISDEIYASYLKRFGIGGATHVDFPGEGIGSLDDWENWPEVQAANISFGQGVSVSPLQMAAFYGAVANDGIKYQPHFLIDRPQALERSEFSDKSERIMRSDTAQELTGMLTSVVSDGTGHAARIEGYTVAGKTGTAQKALPEGGGYLPDDYIVSFVGFFAGSESKLVCIASMDNPIGAESNAPTGPLFASIMQFAANRYMIEPA
jgi:cell division protein FtsI (penicillin-binding protein 3)